MSNVVRFRATQSRASTLSEEIDVAQLDSRITDLQSKAKDEICRCILLLDLAAQHARQIAKRVHNPAVRQDFNANITAIEQLLQFARDMALKL